MTFMELLVLAWVCDDCGFEYIGEDDNLPAGWQAHPSGAHVCGSCAVRPALAVVR